MEIFVSFLILLKICSFSSIKYNEYNGPIESC